MPILLFANQKGGVGKSTLATLYANHLAKDLKMDNILIVDTDFQKSIKNLREEDIALFRPSQEEIGYEVEDFDLDTEEKTARMIQYTKELCEERPKSVIIFDFPGVIPEKRLGRILYAADYIVCPMKYDPITLSSTSTFIDLVLRIMKSKGGNIKKTLLFLPNNIANNEGKISERIERQKTNEILNNFGIVLPQISRCVDFGRLCTLISSKRQIEVSQKCFHELDEIIFNQNA